MCTQTSEVHLPRRGPCPRTARASIEEAPERLGLESGRGDDETQVGAPLLDLLEEPKEGVRWDGALVRLVHNNHAVLAQEGVLHHLADEHSVRHVHNACLRAGHRLKPNRIPYVRSERASHLRGDAGGDALGGNPSRLGDGDPAPAPRPPRLVQVLRHLRGLPAPGLAHEDRGRVGLDKVEHLLADPVDGEALALLLEGESVVLVEG
mmetsp:Transcript_39093/g.124458  ORF Transcript_39093/g.124458 Transcript_39093/m.124458 type:complete len:207 (-) Transcript_39093:265-885(-)